jgi:hypothetical protein
MPGRASQGVFHNFHRRSRRGLRPSGTPLREMPPPRHRWLGGSAARRSWRPGGSKGGCRTPLPIPRPRSAAASIVGESAAGDSAPNRAGRSQRGLPHPFANPPPTECRCIDSWGKRSWGQSPQKGPAGPRGPGPRHCPLRRAAPVSVPSLKKSSSCTTGSIAVIFPGGGGIWVYGA